MVHECDMREKEQEYGGQSTKPSDQQNTSTNNALKMKSNQRRAEWSEVARGPNGSNKASQNLYEHATLEACPVLGTIRMTNTPQSLNSRRRLVLPRNQSDTTGKCRLYFVDELSFAMLAIE